MLWRRLHAAGAIIWVVAIVVQVLLAGLAITNLGGSGDFSTHREVGYDIGFIQLVVVLLALAAKLPRRDILIALLILGDYIVQTLLPPARGISPFIAALHPLNAMFLFALSIWYARHAWRSAMAPEAMRQTPAGILSAPAEAKVG